MKVDRIGVGGWGARAKVRIYILGGPWDWQ